MIFSISSFIHRKTFIQNHLTYILLQTQTQVLAVPGVLIATFLTALLIHTFQPEEYEWTWTSAIAFGAMISATDPVAVVALLKELNAPTNLGVIIEGESLFNDDLVHHALLRHTSSGNFENPQDTAETLLADPHALAEFSQVHWGEIEIGRAHV